MLTSRPARTVGGLLLAAAIGAAAPGSAIASDGHRSPQPKAWPSVSTLNSTGSDFELTVSADGKTAIFASNRDGGVGGNDVWTSRQVHGAWQTPVNIGTAINTSANEQEATVSDDGNLLYFTRYTSPLNGDLYVSRKVDGVWRQAENWNDVAELPHVNTPASEDHCPLIVSKDLIYFSHDVPGVTQKSDIWQVERKHGVWGAPRPLPGKINSPYRDHLHWTGLSKDGNSLVIVSDRPDLGSLGGSDEWVSYKGRHGRWSAPVNLGAAVNTSAGEVCWAFTPDGRQFTGSSSKPGGLGSSDLYAVDTRDIPSLRHFEPNAAPPINLLA